MPRNDPLIPCDRCTTLCLPRNFSKHRRTCFTNLPEFVEAYGDQLIIITSSGCVQLTGERKARPSIRGRSAARVIVETRLGRRLDSDEQTCHTCDNPMCVNWWHIWIGNDAHNTADRTRKGRTRNRYTVQTLGPVHQIQPVIL